MNKKVIIFGGSGFVGKALVDRYKKMGWEVSAPTSKEVNLCNSKETFDFLSNEKYTKLQEPSFVIYAAGKVGGIQANIDNPYEFLTYNLLMQNNTIDACISLNIKLIFLGSSCIYPKDYIQPLKEEYLLQAPLEETNEGYALAKIAGLKQCEYAVKQYNANIISLMPCNLYGPGDHFNLETSHVLGALIKKICDAKNNNESIVEIWGDGSQRREFLYIEDLVDAIIFAENKFDKTETFLNVGCGKDFSIKNIAELIKSIVQYKGEFKYSTDKPTGMKQKLLDITKIQNEGWYPKTEITEGLENTILYYIYERGINDKVS